MDLKLRKPEEVVALLYERLRKERLYLEMTQADVAGIGVNPRTTSQYLIWKLVEMFHLKI